jgi:hypothetical protein
MLLLIGITWDPADAFTDITARSEILEDFVSPPNTAVPTEFLAMLTLLSEALKM